jgi:hypothetical protein
MSRYKVPEGTPYEVVWAVTNDGHVIHTKAYKVEDAFPDADPSYKWRFRHISAQTGKSVYDQSNPQYIVPEADYVTYREFLFSRPEQAALAALERWKREQDRQDARLASITAALEYEG